MGFGFQGAQRHGCDCSIEPLVVTPRDACRLLAVGNTRLYELIAAGELESYSDGRARRITMASIRARIARLLSSEQQPEAHGDASEGPSQAAG